MVEGIVTYGGWTITFVCRRYPNRVNTDVSQSWREFGQIISPFVAEIVVFIIPPKSLQNYPFGTLCKAKVQEHGSEQEQKQSFHLVDYFPQVNEKAKIMRYLNSTCVEKNCVVYHTTKYSIKSNGGLKKNDERNESKKVISL
jgi:hypothetical protein